MNAVIWARVSSREQREGYSLDAQIRICRAKAEREGLTVVREFVVAESAKRGAERIAFNEMYDWVRRNARKEAIGLILSHKLDRICRNMRDAVRMQELEDKHGPESVTLRAFYRGIRLKRSYARTRQHDGGAVRRVYSL